MNAGTHTGIQEHPHLVVDKVRYVSLIFEANRANMITLLGWAKTKQITLFYFTVTSVGICRLNGWNGKKNVSKQLCKSISDFQSIPRGS